MEEIKLSLPVIFLFVFIDLGGLPRGFFSLITCLFLLSDRSSGMIFYLSYFGLLSEIKGMARSYFLLVFYCP